MSTGKFQNPATPRFYTDLIQYFKIIGHKFNCGEKALYPYTPYEGSIDDGTNTTPVIFASETNPTLDSPLATVDPYIKRNSLFTGTAPEAQHLDKFFNFSDFESDYNLDLLPHILPVKNIQNYINYCALLGHDLAGPYNASGDYLDVAPYIRGCQQNIESGEFMSFDFGFSGYKNVVGTKLFDGEPNDVTYTHMDENSFVNLTAGSGFSIFEMNNGINYVTSEEYDEIAYSNGVGIRFTCKERFNPANININSIMMGSYFDMPVSPNMQLSFEREYDGIDTTRTRGGGTLTNVRFTGPPPFAGYSQNFTKFHAGNVPNSNISRSGRRKWRLKFDALADDKVMGAYEAITASPYPDMNFENSVEHYEEEFTVPQDNGGPINSFYNPLLEEDNFFSKVLMPTLGGRIPFIFNPRGGGNSPDNSPDQFALCTIDNKSLSFKQVNHRLYTISLDIVESW